MNPTALARLTITTRDESRILDSMPTETDPTPIPHAQDVNSTASLHTTCPPEEQVQAHAPREERIDGPLPNTSPDDAGIIDDRHASSEEGQRTRTEDAIVQTGADSELKHDEIREVVEFSSTTGSPEVSSARSEGTPAQSTPTATLRGVERERRSPKARAVANKEVLDRPRYLSYPSFPGRQKVGIPITYRICAKRYAYLGQEPGRC